MCSSGRSRAARGPAAEHGVMSPVMHRWLLLPVLLAVQGCVLTQRTFVRNNTDAALVVSVQKERKDLGWPRKEDRTLPVPPHTICSVRFDIFYDTFLYIDNAVTGRSTNITALEDDSYIYTVSDIGGKQVVAIAEADAKTERQFPNWSDQCVAFEPGP